ncbi:RHS repeat protein [Myroides sp. M-43]|uniref:RHS repeat domain-containing protein n=1 Tax=Myroides oncorhynchi TaxID=2893756 RepID=UPI001E530FE5|nr:RHS repeat domain-containing protein [Myroides oncorhynchi]MCC9041169.1 RHS repeat protein [Myroides oncorhynchi]MCC9043640.1 RHS repeat protein [Myroides oncorhynchi]
MKRELTILFFILIKVCLYGQTESVQQTKFNSLENLPPEVRKYVEYGDYSLNYTRAVPNISLPIYTISTKTGLEIPISLDYVSKGIKVNELASNVGLGWLLNAYGVITVDHSLEYDLGVNMKTKLKAYDTGKVYNTDSAVQDLYSYLDVLNSGVVQGKSPVYSYNFLGRNGQFIFDSTGKYFGIPYSDMEISLSLDKNTITIKDTQANIYYFSKHSYRITSDQYPQEFTSNNIFYVLSKIKLSNSEEIEFSYYNENTGLAFLYHYQIQYDFDNDFDLEQSAMKGELGGVDHNLRCNRTLWPENRKVKISGASPNLNIKEIKYGNTKISFKYSSQEGLLIDNTMYRKDVGTTAKALKKIEISYNNQLVNQFMFNYGYFVSDDNSTNRPEKYRLKLLSVTNNQNEVHRFEYNEDVKLPPRDSFALDRWGNYNARIGNQDLLPSLSFKLQGSAGKTDNKYFNGSNRNDAYFSELQAYLLKKITYPTKGYTEFFYSQPTSVIKTVKEKTISFGDGITLNIYDTGSRKTATYSLRDMGYSESNKDVLYLNYTNSCDNAYPSDNSGLDQFVGEGTNGTISINLPSGYTLPPYHRSILYRAGGTKNGVIGPIKSLGDKIDITLIRQGSCFLSGGIRIERTVPDTITSYQTAPIIHLSSYRSYNHNNVLEKEVRYDYKQDIKSPHTQAAYNLPVLHGVSERTMGAVSSANSRTCRAIVRASSAMNHVKEAYFPYVHETIIDVGRTYYEFSAGANNAVSGVLIEPYPSYEYDFNYSVKDDFKQGILLHKSVFGLDSKLKHSLTNTYEFNESFTTLSNNSIGTGSVSYNVLLKGKFSTNLNSITGATGSNNYFSYQLLPIKSAWIRKTSETERSYFENDFIETKKTYLYGNTIESPVQINTVLKNKNRIEKFTYPSSGDLLYANNKKAEVIKYELSENSEKLQTIENTYKNWGNNIIDKQEIKISKGTSALESNQKILHRDSRNGNIIELETDGVKQTYIYGYSSGLLIAKIENASKEEVASALGVSLANLHTIDESKFTQINNLRGNASLKEALITTYEHKPLVGVTKITDAKGEVLLYEYDGFNRLTLIKDSKGNKLKEYQYNYKNN